MADEQVQQDTGLGLIVRERIRQIRDEGHTAAGDIGHSEELIAAAACYTFHALALEYGGVDLTRAELPVNWPWESQSWKPGPTAKRDLEKAGALTAAALDAMIAEEKNNAD